MQNREDFSLDQRGLNIGLNTNVANAISRRLIFRLVSNCPRKREIGIAQKHAISGKTHVHFLIARRAFMQVRVPSCWKIWWRIPELPNDNVAIINSMTPRSHRMLLLIIICYGWSTRPFSLRIKFAISFQLIQVCQPKSYVYSFFVNSCLTERNVLGFVINVSINLSKIFFFSKIVSFQCIF